MGSRGRRLVELGKDALILLLTCSALWLTVQSPLITPLQGIFGEEPPQASAGYGQREDPQEGELPMAMAANLPGGERGGARYGALYDRAACQALFQQVAGPLVEALSSAGTPQVITRGQWEEVLGGDVGVFLDFQGDVPIPVLMDWLSGGESPLNAVVRRLMLAVWEEGLALYYQDRSTGQYYRCTSEVADSAAFTNTLSTLTSNGVFFAFESELYDGLYPDTLLPGTVPAPQVYTVSNPAAGGQRELESIVQDLGFSVNATSFYSTDEQVARSGEDSVRMSDRGVLFYQAGEGEARYPLTGTGEEEILREGVELCRRLAGAVLNGRCGDARLYLISVSPLERGGEIDFGYSLNGIPVHLDQGYAARFLVAEGRVEQFTLRLRSYSGGGGTGAVLPARQAAAALLAQGGTGAELALVYLETGGDTLSASWAGRDNGWEG